MLTTVLLVISLLFNFLLCISLYSVIRQNNRDVSRLKKYYQLTNRWLKNNQRGQKTAEYFVGEKTIAIYGTGELGTLLYDDLKGSSVSIQFFIDQDEGLFFDNIPIIRPSAVVVRPEVDEIIITPIHCFREIKMKIEEAGFKGKITSLEDVII